MHFSKMDSPTDESELRNAIYEHLIEKGLDSRVKDALLLRGNNLDDLTENQLLEVLEEEGIMKDIISFISSKFKREKESEISSPKSKYLYGYEKCLQLHLGHGRAFVEYLLEPEPLPGQPISTLKLHIHFYGQRYTSQSVPAVCDPEFSETAIFHFGKGESLNFIALDNPIHLVLVKTNPYGETILLSSHFLEWRDVLAAPDFRLALPLELTGIGIENKVPIGLLEVELSLMSSSVSPLRKEAVSVQLQVEKTQAAERNRLFHAYSKLWWQEYIKIRQEHAQRPVKIFTQDENAVTHPVISWISPLRLPYLIKTPREAAWFISLFKHKSQSVSEISQSNNYRLHLSTLISVKSGNCEDRAALLCCLLLGFGLDAFVCVGREHNDNSIWWVLTTGKRGLVTFWDCTTAMRYMYPLHPERKFESRRFHSQCAYKSITCVYSHKKFYANCQPADDLEECSFDFNDSSKWKSMSADALDLVNNVPIILLTFLPPTINESKATSDLEQQLKILIIKYRRNHGMTCYWDEYLSHILASAVTLYEIHGKTGLTGGDEEFLTAVHRMVPQGHTFKALPIHFRHKQAEKIFSESLKQSLGKQIIDCRGDQARLAISAYVNCYAENLLSVWVMYAVKYKEIL